VHLALSVVVMPKKSERADEESLMMDHGLPYLTDDEKDAGKSAACRTMIVLLFAPRILGFCIAACIYFPARAWYDGAIMRMALNFQAGGSGAGGAAAYVQGDYLQLGFLFLALGVLSILVNVLNLQPMNYKSMIMKSDSANLRSNMIIYKVAGADGDRHPVPAPDGNLHRLPYVVMEDDGEVGEYNRANRALQHFNENATVLPVLVLASGFIFPLTVFILVCLYAICRIWYQIAYAEGGFGMGCCKHFVPFMLHSIVIAPVFEMLVWIIGVRMFFGVY